MIVLNLTLMTLVAVGIVSLLSWAISAIVVASAPPVASWPPAVAPLHRNLVMPRELRAHGGRATARLPRTPRAAAESASSLA